MGIRIRQAPSGQEIVGSVTGQILVWNDTTKRWDIGAAPGGGGSPIPRNYWVSPLAIGSTQDGTPGNPYLTAQAAVDKLELDGVPGVLWCAAGTGYANLVVSTVDVCVIGYGTVLGPSRPFFGTITVNGGVRFTAVDIGCVTFTSPALQGNTLDFFGCTMLACNLADCTIRCFKSHVTLNVIGGSVDTVTVECLDSAVGGIGSFGDRALSAKVTNCIGIAGDINVIAATLSAVDSELGNLTINDLELINTTVSGIATVNTTLVTDSYSLTSLRASGLAHSIFGALTITDQPLATGLVFAVGALAASFADVTVALPGCKPGDTFKVTTTVRLADVGIVDAFCDLADVLTLRFFGTTAGGNVTCNVNRQTNSA